jgi:hypothetical protein
MEFINRKEMENRTFNLYCIIKWVLVILALLLFVESKAQSSYARMRSAEVTKPIVLSISHVYFKDFNGTSFDFEVGYNDFYTIAQVAPQGLGFYFGFYKNIEYNKQTNLGLVMLGGFQYNKDYYEPDFGVKIYAAPWQSDAATYGFSIGASRKTRSLGFVMIINKY